MAKMSVNVILFSCFVLATKTFAEPQNLRDQSRRNSRIKNVETKLQHLINLLTERNEPVISTKSRNINTTNNTQTETNAGRCNTIPNVKSTIRFLHEKPSYMEGEQVKHTCQYGFDAIGDVKTFCGPDGNWSEPRYGCNRCYGNWALIFRAMSRIGGEPSQLYADTGLASEKDHSIPHGCSSRHNDGHCRNHYRSSLIDDWDLLKPKKVKLELLAQNGHVAHVVFNAVGSTSTSWFEKSRVLSSSWVDIKERESNYFSIFGEVKVTGRFVASRRWMMSSWFRDCDQAVGWMFGIEQSGRCAFDRQEEYPVFLYSSDSGGAFYKDFREADIMAVYVEADGLCD